MGAAALTFICVIWLKGDEGYAHVNALNDLVWGERRNENAALLSSLALKSCGVVIRLFFRRASGIPFGFQNTRC